MIITHKTKLKLNKTQKHLFDKYFGYRRYCYNNALNTWNEMYKLYKQDPKNNKIPGFYNVRNYMVSNKKDWEYEYNAQILKNSVEDLSIAYNNFFKHGYGKPKFKKKGYDTDRFRIIRETDKTFNGTSRKILRLPNIGKIKMYESLRFEEFNPKIKRVTITRKADLYFVSIMMEIDDKYLSKNYINAKNNDYCGVDLGVKTFAIINGTDDNESYYEIPSIIKSDLINIENKISYYQRKLSFKVKNSKHYLNTKTKIQRLYLKKSNLTNNLVNQTISFLCKKYKYITIEDLNTSGLLKNKNLSRVIADSLFYKFKERLKQVSLFYNNKIIIADRFFASSQICSKCGHRFLAENKLKLKDRVYECPECGSIIDRDVNAAINLKLYGMRFMAELQPNDCK